MSCILIDVVLETSHYTTTRIMIILNITQLVVVRSYCISQFIYTYVA